MPTVDLCRSYDDSVIFVPDIEVKVDIKEQTYVPLKGAAFTLAVIQSGKCVGWCLTESLGHESVKDYIASKLVRLTSIRLTPKS